ncbi:MAG: ATPase domain-containing protein, partial [Chloroflexota bacterium]
LHFLVEGAKNDEPTVMATFEESPAEHAEKMRGFGWDLDDLQRRGLAKIIYLRPVDLSIDEVMSDIGTAVTQLNAQRVIINSISGLEVALPSMEQGGLREGLYRLASALEARGVTTLLTTEVPDLFGGVRLTTEGISFLADSIIFLRYVEISSELRKALMVVKMRTSDHDKELREYRIGKNGVTVERALSQYSGLMTGIPTLRTLLEPQPFTTGLTEQEESLMHTLLALRQASAEELAAAMGSAPAEVATALAKLVDTGYVVKTTRAGKQIYRVALITPGMRP